jgi:hypothetical protein
MSSNLYRSRDLLPLVPAWVRDYDDRVKFGCSGMVITRRKLIARSAAMTLLAGCKPHAVHTVAGLTRDAVCGNKLDLKGWRTDSTRLILRLHQLLEMPATERRVSNYCVDGRSAVASWRGVRVSEIMRLVGLDRRVKYLAGV